MKEDRERKERSACGLSAKEYLSQAYYLELQVQSKLEQLERLKSLAARVNASYDAPVVKHTRNTSSLEDTVIKITEAEEDLNRKIDNLVSKKLEINQVIDQVENEIYRLVLEKRYLSFLQWETIAKDLRITRRWLQESHKAALREVEKILEKMEE